MALTSLKTIFLNRRITSDGEIFEGNSLRVYDEIKSETIKLEGKFNRSLHMNKIIMTIRKGSVIVAEFEIPSLDKLKRLIFYYAYFRLPKNEDESMNVEGEIHFKSCDIFLKRVWVSDASGKKKEYWARFSEATGKLIE